MHNNQKFLGTLLLSAVILLLTGFFGNALADDDSYCKDPNHPCTFDIDVFQVQKVPAVFKFQSRISQAKFPIGDAEFSQLVVKVEKYDGSLLCMERFSNVKVRDSVLNLEIGRMVTCELDEIIRDNNNLMFRVCIGGEAEQQCLKPIAMGSVPYAVKSSFANQAYKASRADQSAQSHYAHRMAADHSLFVNNQIGTGYFEFYTPKVPEGADQSADPVVSLNGQYQTDFIPYEHDGFVEWAQVLPPVDKDGNPVTIDGSEAGHVVTSRLHICAKDLDTRKLKKLDELVFHAEYIKARGNVGVDGTLEVSLDSDFLQKAHVYDSLTVDNGGTVSNGLVVNNTSGTGLTVDDGAKIFDGAQVEGKLVVANEGTTVPGTLPDYGICSYDGLYVQNGAQVYNKLIVSNGTTINKASVPALGLYVADGVQITGGATVSGGIVGDTAALSGALTSANVATGNVSTSANISVGTDIAVTGSSTIGGNQTVGGTFAVTGETTGSSMNLSGALTLPNASFPSDNSGISLNENVLVGGDLTVTGSITITGDPELKSTPGTSSISSEDQFSGTPVTANVIDFSSFQVSNNANELTIKKDVHINDNLYVNGKISGAYKPMYSPWSSVVGDGGAGIVNDNMSYKTFMIVGNTSGGGLREIGMWDNVTIDDNLHVKAHSTMSGGITVNNGATINGGLTVNGGFNSTGNLDFVNMYMRGTDFVMKSNGRGPGGRALVHDSGEVLTINYAGDFANGVRISSDLSVHGKFKINNKIALTEESSNQLYLNKGNSFTGGVAVGSSMKVEGNLQANIINTGSYDPYYSRWDSVTGDGGASIVNDNYSYKTLMIVGNNSAGGDREVKVWDHLSVASKLRVGGSASVASNLTVNGNLHTKGTLRVDGNVTGLSATLTSCAWVNDRCETSGSTIYLDRGNNVACPANKVLVDWNVDNCGGGKYKLKFNCCAITVK